MNLKMKFNELTPFNKLLLFWATMVTTAWGTTLYASSGDQVERRYIVAKHKIGDPVLVEGLITKVECDEVDKRDLSARCEYDINFAVQNNYRVVTSVYEQQIHPISPANVKVEHNVDAIVLSDGANNK
jgi:hypothetical protein